MSAGAHPLHHHHHAGSDQAAQHGGVHGDPTCPYAQSAGSAPLPTLPILAAGAVVAYFVPTTLVSQTFPPSGPVRKQTSRGPPPLA
jgi:hypothetical protein